MAVIPQSSFHPSRWQVIVTIALLFWVSGSLVLDFIVMPSLYSMGMMSTSSFAAVGTSLFGAFNRIELIAAGVTLAGVLALTQASSALVNHTGRAIALSAGLVAIALLYTYGFTPHMAELSVSLSPFEVESAVPASMNWMHGAYFVLELCKLAAATILLDQVFKWSPAE